MQNLSRFALLVIILAILASSTILLFAATEISNPFCTTTLLTDTWIPSVNVTVSGDGSRAIMGGDWNGTEAVIWDLNSKMIIDDLESIPHIGMVAMDYEGSRIAFYSYDNPTGQNADGSYELFLWNSGTITQLTNLNNSSANNIQFFSPPSMSDDGTQIAFMLTPNVSATVGDIYVHDSFDIGGYYLWEQGLGIRRLVAEDTPRYAEEPIIISPDGNAVIFAHDGNLTGADPTNAGAFYQLDLNTDVITHLENYQMADTLAYQFNFLTSNYDGTEFAFSVFGGLVTWDYDSGFDTVHSGSSLIVLHNMTADGERIFFQSRNNPTSQNADRNDEFFLINLPNSIRQLTSKTGWEFAQFGNAMSHDGSRALIISPQGEDYAEPYDAFFDTRAYILDCPPTSIGLDFYAPSVLRSTGLSQTSVNLAWNDNSSNETNFRIERSLNGTNWLEIATNNANDTTYTDSGLNCNTSYYYRVRAYRSGDAIFSGYSNTTTVTTNACSIVLPAPSNLVSTSVSQTSIDLAWNDNSSDETSFRIERSLNGSTWTEIASNSANDTTYTNSSLTCGTNYYYRVRAYRSGTSTYSSYSNTLSLSTSLCTLIAPSNLISTNYTYSSIDMAWNDNSSDESNFRVERSLNNATWLEVTINPANDTTYTDSGLTCGTTYYYRVRAYRSTDSSYSSYSNTLMLTTTACLSPITAPSDLVSVGVSQSSVELAWSDNSNDESHFRIERSLNNSTWTEVATLSANLTSYTNNNLTCSTTYYYRVRAYRSTDSAYSSYSNTISIVTNLCNPSAPTNLAGVILSQTSIELTWTDNSSDESNFRIERSPNNSIWTEIDTNDANDSSYSDSNLTCGTSYYYRVRAYRAADNTYSAYSNVALRTTTLCSLIAPTNLIRSSMTKTSITITWEDSNSNESNVRIERSSNGSQWMQIAVNPAYETSYTNSSLTCGTTYYYRVRVYRAADNSYSPYSDVLMTSTSYCDLIAPSSLSISNFTHAVISLSWSDNTNSESSYRIERSLNGTNWTELASVGANSSSYSDTTVACNTRYYYRVRAHRSADNAFSAYTNSVNQMTPLCPVAAPSNLQIISRTGQSVQLEWEDNASDETRYWVERSRGRFGYEVIANLPANSNSYVDTNISCIDIFHYRVRAYRTVDNGQSQASNIVSTECAMYAPEISSIEAWAVPTGVRLTWNDITTTGTNFYFERSLDGVTWSQISLGVGQNADNPYQYSGTSTQNTCNTLYYFRMRAYRQAEHKYTGYSNVVSVTTSACDFNLHIYQNSSNLTLRWQRNYEDTIDYQLEVSTDAIQWEETARPPYYFSSYTGFYNTCDVRYYFRIRAYRANDVYSPYSDIVEVVRPACPVAAPSFFSYTRTYNSLSFTWQDNATNETRYELEKSVNGTWQSAAILGSNSTSYTDNLLTCQTRYSYRLRAVNETSGAASSWQMIYPYTATCPPLEIPTLSMTGNAENSISLEWSGDANATVTSYQLSRFTGNQWLVISSLPPTTLSYSHTGLVCGQTYQYRVQALRSGDNANISSSAMNFSTAACAPVGVPSAPTIMNSSSSMISLQIPALPATATSFNLERSLDASNWAFLGTAMTGTYMDTAVTCGQNYYYRLSALRATDGQVSAPSSSVMVTTPVCPAPSPASTIGIYRAGQWSFVQSNNTLSTLNQFSLGDATWQPLIGDWNGDGQDGVGIYRNGTFVLQSSVAGQIQEISFNFGTGQGQAIVGDWNGDGVDSVGIYHAGVFILSDDNLTISYQLNLGDAQAGWIAVVGDWNGNHSDEIGLYKEGVWLLVESVLNPMPFAINYGPAQAGWLPVVGDWNGDGVDTIGLFNNGLWRLRYSSNHSGDEMSIVYGAAGDIPLAGYEGIISSAFFSGSGSEIDIEIGTTPFPTIVPPEPELTPEVTPEVTPES